MRLEERCALDVSADANVRHASKRLHQIRSLGIPAHRLQAIRHRLRRLDEEPLTVALRVWIQRGTKVREAGRLKAGTAHRLEVVLEEDSRLSTLEESGDELIRVGHEFS